MQMKVMSRNTALLIIVTMSIVSCLYLLMSLIRRYWAGAILGFIMFVFWVIQYSELEDKTVKVSNNAHSKKVKNRRVSRCSSVFLQTFSSA